MSSLWKLPAHKLRAAQARQLVSILRETDTVIDPQQYRSKLPGDERSLRGIPAIGRGVSGAIPGSRPGDRLSL